MITSKLEVLVDFGSKEDSQLIEKTLNRLKAQDGVTQALYKDGALMVETTLASSVVLDLVADASGKRAVLQGFGESQSAVAMISSQSCCRSQVLGVIRFQQSSSGPLVGDGTVHGLTPGLHGLHVRDAGDLSMGCESLGEHYNPHDAPHGGPLDPPDKRHAGDLGNIVADEDGRATFRIVDRLLQIHEIVGRSVAVTERADDLGLGSTPASKIDGDSGPPVACGIIARSAGIFQNPKRICACDGVVVWDERDKPLAGKGRRDTCCERDKGYNPLTDKGDTCCDRDKGHVRNNSTLTGKGDRCCDRDKGDNTLTGKRDKCCEREKDKRDILGKEDKCCEKNSGNGKMGENAKMCSKV